MLQKINSVGIQQRLLLLAILPVIITTMLLGYYVITSRIDDINSKLLDRGRDFAKHVAPSVEFAITARNKEVLRGIVERALQEDDVVRIGIYDEAGKLLLQKDADIDLKGGEVFSFTEAIIQTSIEMNAEDGMSGEQDNSVYLKERKVGEVKVEFSNLKTKEEEKIILVNSFLIMASGLLLSAILALRIGGTVANPIIHLTRAMQLLRSGNFDARVQVAAEGELGTLQSGFNGMAETLQESQKGLQQQVDKATKELRDIVAELEKKNSELEEARQEALQAGQAKLDFLAKMSHEIRTPVNAIIGFARLLENIIEQEGALEYTRTINQASKQLLCVIDDILDFSKIEYGTLSFENIPFNLRDMIEDVVVMQRPAAYEKKLELIFNYFSDVPDDVFGDSARISQVLGNLLNNAVKFTEQGSIIIQVEVTERKVGEYSRFLISVIDNGIGIG
ncbi:MAG: HAMP domain-containing protein, partial [Gammaproteobacteria bacterium]|nr:HAMP domain-containing protein [Gammaproteobacteria bacterium]